ncbi:hypothetical protein S40293_05567 [Stachybotrys chartarum IBT 40293]|nr:hypothetical protein S40293_05567 [Stachybotrys chartarum IBT 40293]
MRVSRANTVFGLVWFLLLVWCYHNSYDDPSSAFYNPDKAFDLRFSAVRAAEVDRYIQSLGEGALPGSKHAVDSVAAVGPDGHDADSSNSLLCIGIPSINRTINSFLERTVGSLVDALTAEERASIHIVVLLADRTPGQHSAYGQPWLTTLADDVVVYESSDPKREHDKAYRVIPFNVRGVGRGDGRVENMRLDHSVLVESCHNHGSRYFALIEDDVIASRDWFRKFKSGVDYVERRAEQSGKDWIYLRLFFSEFFMGWNNEEVLDYLEAIFIVYAVILLGFVEMRRRRKRNTNANSLTKGITAQSFNYIAALALGLWTPALIALYFMAGRVTMHRLSPFPLSGVREMPRYGCCAQGLVFPKHHLEGFQALLRDPPYDFAGDMILEGWAGDRGLTKWALDPSVLQHVGLAESSDGPRRAEVWNFSFERQHKR